MFGIFETQTEITKKNGRLCGIDDAVRLAESECANLNLVESFDTLEAARDALAKYSCELYRSQFWAIGSGYNAYMKLIVEYDVIDGEMELGDYLDFAAWTTPVDDEG